MTKGCPHRDIRFCPLYHGAHIGGPGCDDGQLGNGECAVARGMDYAAEKERLRVREARLVAELEWREAVEESKAQRLRNMKAAGLH